MLKALFVGLACIAVGMTLMLAAVSDIHLGSSRSELSSSQSSFQSPASSNQAKSSFENPQESSDSALFYMQASKDSDTPYDRIHEKDIEVYPDKVVVHLKKGVAARFTDTGSMEPTFGSEANAIEIVPSSPEEIHKGDIVSYYSNIAKTTIIHRVDEIGYDSQGWFAYFKGDNIKKRDPEKVRFNQIKRVVVMLIY